MTSISLTLFQNQHTRLLLMLSTLFYISACAINDSQMTETSEATTKEQTALNIVDITNVDQAEPMHTEEDRLMTADNFGAPGQLPLYSSMQGAYKGRPLTKHIGDYVKNLTQDLVSNMDYVTQETPIGVTHFALLDSDLQHTNLLGRQMAESFMHEMHKFRIPVIDFKATDYIRVTEHGDFVLSRDYLELSDKAVIEYILTGTLAKHQGGYMVNARVIGMQSKAVVASAQTLVPFYVVDALMPSHEGSDDMWVDGIKLSKGSE